MKTISIKPKGQRIMKSITLNYGTKGKIKRPFWIEPLQIKNEPYLSFCLKRGDWFTETTESNTSAYYSMNTYGFNDVYSLRAVIRLVKKWNVPKGTKFRVILPFAGYEFIITK